MEIKSKDYKSQFLCKRKHGLNPQTASQLFKTDKLNKSKDHIKMPPFTH